MQARTVSFIAITLWIALSPLAHSSGSVLNEPLPSVLPVAKQFTSFAVGGGDVLTLAFTPDRSELFLATFLSSDIQVWSWQGQPHLKRTLHGPQGTGVGTRADGMVFSSDGKLLAVSHDISSDHNGPSVIRILTPQTGETIYDIGETLSGGNTSGIAFSSDGKQFIRTFDRDAQFTGDQLMIHDLATWSVIWSLHLIPLQPTSLCLSPDGQLAAVGGITLGPGVPHRAQIIMVDLARHRIVRTIDEAFAPGTGVERMAWSTDGIHLAVGARVGGSFTGPEAVKIFDVTTGEAIARESAGAANISALRYTADGKYLIEGGIENSVRIWDGQHTRLLQTIAAKGAYAVAVTRNSKILAIGDGSHVHLWTLN